ncbi:MAG TPA: EAL domain-containing protein [Jatrophihabitans sp.]|nr:EAL domain-containing protein [Jatrophihabitans sp.]
MRRVVSGAGVPAWAVAAVAAAAMVGGYFALPSGTVQSVGYDVVGFASVIAVWLGVRLNRPADRLTWWLFAAGSLCSVAADSVYTAAGTLNVELPTPSITDALYLAAYPFLFLAVLRLGRRVATTGSRGRWLDAAIVSVAALALSWHLLMNSYAHDNTLTAIGKLTLMAYPVMDLGIVFILVSALLFASVQGTAARLVTVAMVLMLAGDFIYDLLVLRDGYTDGMLLDATWLLNYALIGVAALHPSMAAAPNLARQEHRRRASWVPLMAVAGLVAPILLIIMSVRHEYADVPVLAILVSVMVVLTTARMAGTFDRMRRQAAQLQARTEELRARTEHLQTALLERDSLAADLRHRAFHDSLTGLANRELLRDRIEHALAATGRDHSAVALMLVDLDGFKTVNDSLGHETGDSLLVSAAAHISAVVRPGDTVARLGGDEFVVLMDRITDQADVIAATERVLAALNRPHPVGDHSLTLSGSAGVAIGTSTTNPGQLLSEADAAMYEAKANGRNRYQIYQPALGHRVAERLQISAALPAALEAAQFYLEYQPTYTLGTGRLRGFEALARWRHPTLGLVAPLRFVPLVEETGLIVPFGRWVLNAACQAAAGWTTDPRHGPTIGVNVSALQLRDPGFVKDLRSALTAADLPGERLVIELTESTLVTDPDHTIAVLSHVKRLGVRIAIDDFGTGYSSLSQLQRFPVDALKIDKSFVDRLDDPAANGQAFIAAIVELANRLDITTLAEGIETESQYHALIGMGCDAGQGYLLSRPVSAAATAELIARNYASDVTGVASAQGRMPGRLRLPLAMPEPSQAIGG